MDPQQQATAARLAHEARISVQQSLRTLKQAIAELEALIEATEPPSPATSPTTARATTGSPSVALGDLTTRTTRA